MYAVRVRASFSRLISSHKNTQVAALGLATMPSEGKVRNLIHCFITGVGGGGKREANKE